MFIRTRFFLVVLYLFFGYTSFCQVQLCAWNLQNFGKSKTDSSIRFISRTLKDYDLVALTEVVAGKGGAQAVARLADELNRTGSKWDYCVSDPTKGKAGSSERYAFLWKTSRLKKQGDAFLEPSVADSIEREPYTARFVAGTAKFTLSVYHAVPKNKQPEKEIKFLKTLLERHQGETLLICGDFNCPQSHPVFDNLKQKNYTPALRNQKTTLRMECVNAECLASEYDNVFFPSRQVKTLNAGVITFYRKFPNVKEARRISDHLPVFFEFSLN